MDKAVLGYCRLGYFRLGVFDNTWDELVRTVEGSGAVSLDATRFRLMLFGRDATTGWYEKAYEETAIEIIVLTKASQQLALKCGTYVIGDVLGLTVDVLREGDRLRVGNKYYEVKTVNEHYLGDSFCRRDCELRLLPLEYLVGDTYTDSVVEDARYRMKVFLETYLDSATLPNFIVAYENADYPMVRVFTDKVVDLIFCVGTPDSTALPIGVGYEEKVPITIWCVDKSNISGTKLRWKAETELRHITETYPTGSLRTFERLSDNEKNLGSTVLYSVNYVMRYKRYA